MNRIKVAIVDDHKIIREGIISLFKSHPDIDIAASLPGGQALLDSLSIQEFDVILLDMHMPMMSGIETTTRVIERFPDAKILIHTMSEMVSEIEAVVKNGTRGYILKSAGTDEMTEAIKVVAHGGSYFSTSVMNIYVQNSLGTTNNPINRLSKEELTILAYIMDKDASMKQFAAGLGMSLATLETRLTQIKRKLNIQSDLGLGRFCIKHASELNAHNRMALAEQ